MHTISAEKLLKAYNGKYKYMTKSIDGVITLWTMSPIATQTSWGHASNDSYCIIIGRAAITEFQNRDWEECLYKAKSSEEDWVGCLCWFADDKKDLEKPQHRIVAILKAINNDSDKPYKSNLGWAFCRPVRPDEIKFFNDDTSEE